MLEFLIRRTDAEWFDFPFNRYADVLRPIRTPSEVISGWGSHRIRVGVEEISFSDEDPGFQVVFESGVLTAERARELVAEICENIELVTGQRARLVEL